MPADTDEQCAPGYTLPGDLDAELLRDYMTESLDHVAAAEAALLSLEADPSATEPIHTVFRAFHTIKGTSGFLGLDWIQQLAHHAEDLLSRVRAGELRLSGMYADLALEAGDVLKAMIQDLPRLTPGAPIPIPAGYGALIEKLSCRGSAVPPAPQTAVPRVGDILVMGGKATRGEVEAAAREGQGAFLGESLIRTGVISAADVAQALRTQQLLKVTGADATLRVSTIRLDHLVDMVGELAIAHAMVSQDPELLGVENPRLAKNLAQAAKIVRGLEDLTMALRMVPLRATCQKMTRLVRDLSARCQKPVRFVTAGEEIEIDRGMVDALGDPLVHMIRNAIDHGIEPPEERRRCGKPPVGTLRLRALHTAGHVLIELSDDGRGLDRERILARAIARGLVPAGRELTDDQVFGLLFSPGFSMANQVTSLSGRGVGLDIVRRGVEALQGRVEISSQRGHGTTFTLHLPLTMAVTDAMLVRVGAERYVLPTLAIERSFRPEAAVLGTVAGQIETVLVRACEEETVVPILRLHRIFAIEGALTDPREALLVVIEADRRRCALMVDELLGQQPVVVKPLGMDLGHVPGISGGTILGDGRVVLILDARELLAVAGAVLAAPTACTA